jgi:MarR family transcriptional regulator, lower aerobic nicotinate degradation pathway regulator
MTATRRTKVKDVRAALDAFRRIVQALRMHRTAEPRRVSSARLFALQQIAEHPGASINELAALTFTHQSSVSVVIQRLVEQRLVVRTPAAKDRRRQRLELTAAGRRVLGRAPAATQERLIGAVAALPASERRALAGALERIAHAIAPEQGGHAPMFFESAASPPHGGRMRDPRATHATPEATPPRRRRPSSSRRRY